MNKETFSALLGVLLAGCSPADDSTRAKLEKLLDDLAKKPAPEAKFLGMAMCYASAMPPERIEYACPQCGEKTIYSLTEGATVENSFPGWETINEVESLQYHRGELEKVKKLGLDVSLDERAFCGVCKKTAGFADNEWALYLNVRLNGKTATTCLLENDWDKLIAFLQGKDEWVTDAFAGNTEPLKPELPRIRALLGLEEKTTGKKTTELEGERPREPQP